MARTKGPRERTRVVVRGRAPAPEGAAAAQRARDQRRQEDDVLAAADSVFSARGYHEAGMQEIAALARCAVGTLYNLFASKERLFSAVVLRHLESVDEALRRAIERTEGARERLEAIAIARASLSVKRRSFLRLFAAPLPGVVHPGGPEPTPEVQRVYSRIIARVRSVIEQGMKAGELRSDLSLDLLTVIYESATRAHHVERIVVEGGEPDEREVRSVVAAVLEGLAPRAKRATRAR